MTIRLITSFFIVKVRKTKNNNNFKVCHIKNNILRLN